jgi:ABC-type polar amino acid transport system ATPase subunit
LSARAAVDAKAIESIGGGAAGAADWVEREVCADWAGAIFVLSRGEADCAGDGFERKGGAGDFALSGEVDADDVESLDSGRAGEGEGGVNSVHNKISGHSAVVAEWFGIRSKLHPPTAVRPQIPALASGKIMLITGPSGAGKSRLLRRLGRRRSMPVVYWPRLRRDATAVIDLFGHISVEAALLCLSRVGLAEAHCYLVPARMLSAGQRWRLQLALALSRDDSVARCLMIDEFGSVLDPLTATIVARVLRRSITAESNLCAMVASSRESLVRALAPDLIVRCDFGKVEIWKREKGDGYVQMGEADQRAGVFGRTTRAENGNARRLFRA